MICPVPLSFTGEMGARNRDILNSFICLLVFLVLIINLLILHRNSRIFQGYPSKFVIIKQMTVHTCMYET